MTPKPNSDIWSAAPPNRTGLWWMKSPRISQTVMHIGDRGGVLIVRNMGGDWMDLAEFVEIESDSQWCPVDPPGSAKAEREKSPLAQLEVWAKKHRRVSITAGGFAQPGDGWAVKLSERGREVIVDEYYDVDERLPASLPDVIREALRMWEAGQ